MRLQDDIARLVLQEHRLVFPALLTRWRRHKRRATLLQFRAQHQGKR